MRPQILALNGMSIKDFDSKQLALDAADELIAESSAANGFERQQLPSTSKNPLIHKFWYVHSAGVKRKHSETEKKVMSGETDVKAGKKAVELWFGTEQEEQSSVKIENEVNTALVAAKDQLRIVATSHQLIPH